MQSLIKVKVQKLDHYRGDLPQYHTKGASGMDIAAQLNKGTILLAPNTRALIPTGLIMEIPQGYEIQVRPRSGMAITHGITVLNTPGTIDADFRGEIQVILINHGKNTFIIKDLDRIAQLVLCPVAKMELEFSNVLNMTERGVKGFGSTNTISFLDRLEIKNLLK